VPGTGLEPASRLKRRIFVTLRLWTPAVRRIAPLTTTVRALDYAFTIAPSAAGALRLVSTPSLRIRGPDLACGCPSGLARCCLGVGARGFAEFEGFYSDRFRSGTQFLKSAMFTNFITPAGRT
jgi:hypothetical protein